MSQDNKKSIVQPRAFDILEAKKNSENPSKFFDEAVDNSIQYGSSIIKTEINEKEGVVYIQDDGHGFTSMTALEAFHRPYHIPLESGISKFGIGSKIFKTLADKRIVFSIGKCKDTGKKVAYFSCWDTSTPESTDSPSITTYNVGDETSFSWLETIDNDYVREKISSLLKDLKEGTTVFLTDIDQSRVKNFFKTWSQMSKKVKQSYFERYHLLINQTSVDIQVQYINNRGYEEDLHMVDGFDPRTNIDSSILGNKKPFIKSIRGTKIFSWVKLEARTKLKTRGVHVYRDLIKIATIPFVKRSGHNASYYVDMDHTKLGYRLNKESQIMLIRSNNDEEFNLGETKDKIQLPVQIGLIASDEFAEIMELVKQDRKNKTNKKVSSNGSSIKVSVPATIMELETETSFIKSNDGMTIVNGSTFHESLTQMQNEKSVELFVTILNCFDYVYSEKTDPSEKSRLTKTFNRIGQILEQKLSS